MHKNTWLIQRIEESNGFISERIFWECISLLSAIDGQSFYILEDYHQIIFPYL